MSEYTEAFMESFEHRIDQLADQLQGPVKIKLLRAANNIAAYTELQIRSPDLTEQLALAKKMELGIIQTALAQYELDWRQALKDAVYRGLLKLAELAI